MHLFIEAILVVGLFIAVHFLRKRLKLDDNSPAWVWIGWILSTFFVSFAAFQVITGIYRHQYALLYPWIVTLVAAVGFLVYRVLRGIARLWP